MYNPLAFRADAHPTVARVKLARLNLAFLFGISGVVLSSLLARIPSVRDILGVSPAGLAGLLIFGAIGALVGLTITGYLTARYGTRQVLWLSTWAYFVAVAVTAASLFLASKHVYALGQFLMSFAFSLTNVAINAEAAEIEKIMQRPIMPQFHAVFSVGMAVGLGAAVLLSHYGVSAPWHYLGIAVAYTAVRIVVVNPAVIDGSARPEDVVAGLGGPFVTAREEYRDRRVILLGIVVFSVSMAEMSAAQWLPLSIVDDFGHSEAVGDLIYWTFIVAMVTVRGAGAAIIGYFGRVVTVRISAVATMLGIIIYAVTPVFWLVPVAAMCWGIGVALGVPIGMSAAADVPHRAAARVAAVSSFSTIAGLVVPQIIGQVANLVGLRLAFLLIVAAATVTFVLARAVRKDGKLFVSRRAMEREIGSAVL